MLKVIAEIKRKTMSKKIGSDKLKFSPAVKGGGALEKSGINYSELLYILTDKASKNQLGMADHALKQVYSKFLATKHDNEIN